MAAKVVEIKDQINGFLHDKTKPWAKLLDEAEKKSGVDRLYIFVGVLGVIALWLVFGYAAQLVSNFVGFVYPAYASIKAVESKEKDDDTKWLTYWVVFALFSIVEFFSDLIVGWFPLYWLVKSIFFVWLMIPGNLNGSKILYYSIVRPYFFKHHSKIDKTLNKVEEKIKEAGAAFNKQE